MCVILCLHCALQLDLTILLAHMGTGITVSGKKMWMVLIPVRNSCIVLVFEDLLNTLPHPCRSL